ncbi:L,D-transpeptidase family protein [Thiolapillus sp.]
MNLLRVHLCRQELELWRNGVLWRSYPVSTAAPGEQRDSGCTPRGRHRIRIRIGDGCPLNTVFVGRRPSGEIYTPELGASYPQRDWVLTRILWLTGEESGRNRGGECDTLKRYIYIHGTDREDLIGQPVSHGCIRMKNHDVRELFDLVSNNDAVIIEE